MSDRLKRKRRWAKEKTVLIQGKTTNEAKRRTRKNGAGHEPTPFE
jgi:hypothetical protein